MKRDRAADGFVDQVGGVPGNRVVGKKLRGYLTPKYEIQLSGGTIPLERGWESD